MFNEICILFPLRACKNTEKPITEYHKMGSDGNSVRKYRQERGEKAKKPLKIWGICPNVLQW